MIHLSQSRSSIIFAHDGDSLEVLYWGKKLDAIDKRAAESILSARTKPVFHGGLDVAPGNLILREHVGAAGEIRNKAARLAHQAQFALLEIAQSAMNQLGRC